CATMADRKICLPKMLILTSLQFFLELTRVHILDQIKRTQAKFHLLMLPVNVIMMMRLFIIITVLSIIIAMLSSTGGNGEKRGGGKYREFSQNSFPAHKSFSLVSFNGERIEPTSAI